MPGNIWKFALEVGNFLLKLGKYKNTKNLLILWQHVHVKIGENIWPKSPKQNNMGWEDCNLGLEKVGK